MADRRELLRGLSAATLLGGPAAATAAAQPDAKPEIAAMSDADFAALDFEAWQHEPDEWVPPSNAKWADLANPLAFTLRCAWAMMHLSKPELIEAAAVWDADGGEKNPATEVLVNLQDTEQYFEMMHSIVRQALTRFLIASTAYELRKAA